MTGPQVQGVFLKRAQDNFMDVDFSERKKTYKDLTMVSFTCKDLGMDCSFEVKGNSNSEIMKKFIEHAESAHNMPVLTADVMLKVKKALKKQR